MDFLILRPLPPKTGYHFFWGGGWWGGGGQKFLLNRLYAVGKHSAATPPLVERFAGPRFSVGGSNHGLLTFSGGSRDKPGRPGFGFVPGFFLGS